MRNMVKFISITTLVVLIGFNIIACGSLPLFDTSPAISPGTYTFNPRIRAIQGGTDYDMYIDRIVVRGGYFSIYLSSEPSRNQFADYRWEQGAGRDNVLSDLNNPGRTWRVVNFSIDTTSPGYGFTILTFQGVTGNRFTLSNGAFNVPVVFEEIVLGEPD